MTAWSTAGTTRRALGAALATGVLAAGAAGCGSSDDEATTAASAPTATATSTTAPSKTTATAEDVTPKAEDDIPATTEPLATTAVTPPASTTATTTTTKPGTTTTSAARPQAAPTRSSGSAEDQAAVRSTVDRYMRAFVAGDGATVCKLLDDRQRQLLGSRGAGSCEQATKTAQQAVAKDATIRKALEGLRVSKVSVKGDQAVAAATVATNGRGSAFPIMLSRTSGGWRISSNAPAGG